MENYLISIVTFGAFYALLALGLNVIWGMTGMINLGLAGFFAPRTILEPDLMGSFAEFDLVVSYLYDPDGNASEMLNMESIVTVPVSEGHYMDELKKLIQMHADETHSKAAQAILQSCQIAMGRRSGQVARDGTGQQVYQRRFQQ